MHLRTGPHVIREWDQWSHRWSRDDRFNLVESFYETIYDQWSNGRVTEDTYFKYANSWCDATCHQDQEAQARKQLHTAAAAMGTHLPHLSWGWFLSHWSDWLVIQLEIGGGEALMAAGVLSAIGTIGGDAVAAILSFFNGLDLAVHGITTLIGTVYGTSNDPEYTELMAVEVALDVAVAVVDTIALSELLGGAGIAGALASLAANPAAVGAIGTILGIDVVAVINDWKAAFASLPPD